VAIRLPLPISKRLGAELSTHARSSLALAARYNRSMAMPITTRWLKRDISPKLDVDQPAQRSEILLYET
jgi:hypothetical protein